ncbi:hypothetical protein PSHT_02867 [Puccinia striiformis]|uniref:Uncharacterized protein n=1 Tax=Puccinia striiformis TaxID=27350 RepID=A0A2S4WGV4_9BASI|nr:hypothetical protein PSHT_02867 [Puccinia striiformis]
MNHRHMSQLFHSRIKRSRLLTQSRHTVKNLEGYGVIINKPACKEFLVNVDQEDYEKGVDVEPFTGQAECDCYGVLSSNIQNTSISFPNLKSTCLILANSLLLDNRVLINFHLQHISVPCPSGTRVHYKIENINGSNSHLKISSCSATMLWASSVACCDFLINLAQDPTTTNKPLVYIKQD